MTAKPVVPREQANRDVDDAIAYYLSQGAETAAHGLIDALEQAHGQISRHPATGSPGYAHELNLAGIAIARIRSFRGLNPKSFDGRGSTGVVARIQLPVPQLNRDKQRQWQRHP